MERLIDISIVNPSIRTENWIDICNVFKDSNTANFELIFVGPNIPEFGLPKEINFIHSTTKPAQCAEIGFRAAKGEYVMNTADDLLFPAGHLDFLLNEYKNNYKDTLTMLSGVYGDNNTIFSECASHLHQSDPRSPLVPLCGFWPKELRDKVGSIDNKFICVAWDLDISLRLYEIGAKF